MNAGSFIPFLTNINSHIIACTGYNEYISIDLHIYTHIYKIQKEYKLATVVVQELLEVDELKCIIKFHLSSNAYINKITSPNQPQGRSLCYRVQAIKESELRLKMWPVAETKEQNPVCSRNSRSKSRGTCVWMSFLDAYSRY